MVDSSVVPAWVYTMLARVIEEGHADIVMVIENGACQTKPPSLPHKLRENFRQACYLLLTRIDRRLRPPVPDPFFPMELKGLLDGVDVLHSVPEEKRWSDYLPKGDVEQIRDAELDVILRLGFRILRGEILSAAKFGVWSFHHGDNRVNRGGPAGFWEVFLGWPQTGSLLQILSEDLDAGEVICRSTSQTDAVFVARNKANLYWKSLAFVPRALARLSRLGEEAFREQLDRDNAHPAFYSERLYVKPTNLEMLALTVRHYSRWVLRRLDLLLFLEQWILLFDFTRSKRMSMSFRRFKKLVPPPDRFWADPFIVCRDGIYFIFVEEFIYASGKGRIACLTLAEDGESSAPVTVLDRPHHISYPFVFSHQGADYMIPETSETRRVDLYRCAEFPHRWEFVRSLLEDVCGFDATVALHDDRWWLFVSVREHAGASSSEELFLYSADDILNDDFRPHPANPIVSDVSASRPAGKPFIEHGRLYRPAQNCARRYGYGMTINWISALSERVYEEQPVVAIEPHWEPDIVATHTLNHVENLTMVDAIYRRIRWWPLGPR